MQKVQKTIPFTTKKYKEMQEKVVELTQLREEVMKRLITAREMGDLSENGAYKYAKFELGDIGRQLRRFQTLLAKGFPAPKNAGKKGTIDFGSTVTVEKIALENSDALNGTLKGVSAKKSVKQQKTFLIVSEHESDPLKGKIAYSSPIGKALIRKKVGDIVTVTTPTGESQFKIISIS